MSTPPSEISSLVSLIADAASSIESYYKANSGTVPSLDDAEPHPLDNVPHPSEIRQAVQILEGACLQLSTTLSRPGHTMLNRFLSLHQPMTLGIVLRTKIADVLLDEPTGMPVSEISKRTGIEQHKLGRLLRLLCSHHIFKEVSKDVFANNRLSMQLLASNPLSSFGYHATEEPTSKMVPFMADTLLDPRYGHSLAPEDSAFSRSTGYNGSMFAYFEGKESEKSAIQGARFAKGMIGWSEVVESDRVIAGFPWEELPVGTVVNDLGGGLGHISMSLHRQYPNLSFKLQDLPERVQQAQTEIWPTLCPEAIVEGKVEFKGIDILKETPIPNCDVYFVKHVIHCFADDDAIGIFRNIAKSMSPTSRLLIHEYIVQGADRVPDKESPYKQAPVPLLPNYGAGRIRQYYLDVAVMWLFNSEERTVDGYTKLAEAAGLRFVKFWDLRELGIIEFALAT